MFGLFPAPAPPRKRLRGPSVPPLLCKRLVIAGYSQRIVTLLYIALAAAGLLLAALWYSASSASDLAVILALPLLCVGLWRFVASREQVA